MEGEGTPTTVWGQEHCETRQLAPFYDDIIISRIVDSHPFIIENDLFDYNWVGVFCDIFWRVQHLAKLFVCAPR